MAARFWLGTTSTAWGTSANWSATSGGGGGAGVPTVSDDVTFDGSGNNPCELNSAPRTCLSFTVAAGFTNTITHTQQLTVAGNITLHTGYTIAGAGLLVISASSTILTGGKVWPNSVTLSNTTGLTYTINTNAFEISGTLTIGTGANTTFAGTHGFTVGTLTNISTQVATITLKEAVTYRINSAFTCNTSRVGSIVLFTSAHASTKALINFPNNGTVTCNVLASFTRIEVTGRSINTFAGTVTDCINVNQFYDYKGTAI